MKLSYYCDLAKLNWAAVSELPSHLHRHGLNTTSTSATLRRFPEAVEFEAMEEVFEYVKRKGDPSAFDIHLAWD